MKDTQTDLAEQAARLRGDNVVPFRPRQTDGLTSGKLHLTLSVKWSSHLAAMAFCARLLDADVSSDWVSLVSVRGNEVLIDGHALIEMSPDQLEFLISYVGKREAR